MVVNLVVEGAEAIGCPPDFLAVAALAVAAGAIGRSVSLRLKSNYFASSSLFVALVGPPSDGKTPALKAACSAVKRIDELLEVANLEAMERWEKQQETTGSTGKPPKRTKPPRPQRIDVDDITMEMMPLVLAENPRGLIRINDELTAIMMGMNQFKGGKGNDRPNLLKIWSGDGIKKDRVGHDSNEPIRCPHPCLTIVGGLPPDMLNSMVDQQGRADGFLDRFLFVYPESMPIPEWSDRGIDEATIEAWCNLVLRIWERPMNDKEGRLVPQVAFLEGPALACWTHFYNHHRDEMNAADFPPSLRGPWGKLREYAGRIALILACLHHATDLNADPKQAPTLTPEIIANAWRLIEYFKSTARRVHRVLAQAPAAQGQTYRAVVEWLQANRIESFSIRDVKQARRWIEADELTRVLSVLSKKNVIRGPSTVEPPDIPKPKTGRKPSTVYRVNPALFSTQNDESEPT